MCPKETQWATIGAFILTFKTTGREQGGSKDVFVHISAVERAGLSSLNEGQVVEYKEVSNRGKTAAENLRVQR
jgi:cold shock protein